MRPIASGARLIDLAKRRGRHAVLLAIGPEVLHVARPTPDGNGLSAFLTPRLSRPRGEIKTKSTL